MGNVSRDFEFHGGSYLISDKNYAQYIDGAESIGRPDGQFMIPSNQMNELLAKHSNEPREWERQLGLEKGSLGDSNIHRVDVYNPQDYSPRLPTEDLSGANDKFIPGGKTPGGQDECVINQFPNPENNPSVGKITTIDNGISDTQNTAYNTTSSTNVAYVGGGGARAPNSEIAGAKPTDEASPRNNPPEVAGQKPVQTQTSPENTEPQIAGTAPGKKQEFDANAVKPDMSAANNLFADANKNVSNSVTTGVGVT